MAVAPHSVASIQNYDLTMTRANRSGSGAPVSRLSEASPTSDFKGATDRYDPSYRPDPPPREPSTTGYLPNSYQRTIPVSVHGALGDVETDTDPPPVPPQEPKSFNIDPAPPPSPRHAEPEDRVSVANINALTAQPPPVTLSAAATAYNAVNNAVHTGRFDVPPANDDNASATDLTATFQAALRRSGETTDGVRTADDATPHLNVAL